MMAKSWEFWSVKTFLRPELGRGLTFVLFMFFFFVAPWVGATDSRKNEDEPLRAVEAHGVQRVVEVDESGNQESAEWLDSSKISLQSDIEFRVDNTVRFVRNERQKSYSSSTVFCGDLAFDFVGDNGEIVVYSFSSQKFMLIDPIRRMHTVVNESELDRFLERIKTIIVEKDDSFSLFMTEPKFDVSRKEDEFFFQSKWIDYRVKTVPFNDQRHADIYFRFVEAIGKLNVYMNPGVLTPLARMVANRIIVGEGLFPEKVSTEIFPNGKTIFSKNYQIESDSTIARRLSERDRNRINRAIHFYEQFQFVGFKTYFEKTGSK